MRINIPVKLLKYKEHLKESSYNIAFNRNFTFHKVGITEKEGTFRELYLCYNPYSTNIKLDINHFSANKKIYKLYPPIIEVPSKEMFTFMVFSTTKSGLEFDESTLIYNQKTRISSSLKRLEEKHLKNNIDIIKEEFNPNVSPTIVIDKEDMEKYNKKIGVKNISVSKLVPINSDGKLIKVDKYIAYEKGSRRINVKLKNISYKKTNYNFEMLFLNQEDEDYLIQGFNVRVFDKNLKKEIQIKKEIDFLSKSKREISFSVKEKDLERFLIDDTKIDVEIF